MQTKEYIDNIIRSANADGMSGEEKISESLDCGLFEAQTEFAKAAVKYALAITKTYANNPAIDLAKLTKTLQDLREASPNELEKFGLTYTALMEGWSMEEPLEAASAAGWEPLRGNFPYLDLLRFHHMWKECGGIMPSEVLKDEVTARMAETTE